MTQDHQWSSDPQDRVLRKLPGSCGAANDLRNQAAAMGGNVIYGISSPSQGMLSSFVPTDSQIIGQVYKCPN